MRLDNSKYKRKCDVFLSPITVDGQGKAAPPLQDYKHSWHKALVPREFKDKPLRGPICIFNWLAMCAKSLGHNADVATCTLSLYVAIPCHAISLIGEGGLLAMPSTLARMQKRLDCLFGSFGVVCRWILLSWVLTQQLKRNHAKLFFQSDHA